jgi:hypothetical protein
MFGILASAFDDRCDIGRLRDDSKELETGRLVALVAKVEADGDGDSGQQPVTDRSGADGE